MVPRNKLRKKDNKEKENKYIKVTVVPTFHFINTVCSLNTMYLYHTYPTSSLTSYIYTHKYIYIPLKLVSDIHKCMDVEPSTGEL